LPSRPDASIRQHETAGNQTSASTSATAALIRCTGKAIPRRQDWGNAGDWPCSGKEARKSQEAAEALLARTLQELEPLRKYESLRDAESDIEHVLTGAMTEAIALRKDAQTLLEQSRTAAVEERSKATQRAKEIRAQADALLNQATRDAGRIVEEANKRAEQIGGDAYVALRERRIRAV